MPRTTADFAAGVLDAYRSSDPRRMTLAKSLHESSDQISARAMGHPDFADLPLGGTSHCDGAVVFLDLDEFTSRTFWESPESMVRLALAVLTQVVEVVVDHGGFVLGLRGDGVFACFGGPGSDPRIDVAAALGAAAFALDATENALNNLLIMDGLDPVRLRAGADHGRLDFVRTGCDGANEVNIIGFAANFAAKCEKIADSWELVAGECLGAHVLNKALLRAHPDSPKRYARDGLTRSYLFYDIAWRSIAPHAVGVRDDLAGAPITRVRIR
jgi:adenylate cyclase